MNPIEKDRDLRLVAIFAAGFFTVTAAAVSTAEFATLAYAQLEFERVEYTAPTVPNNSLLMMMMEMFPEAMSSQGETSEPPQEVPSEY